MHPADDGSDDCENTDVCLFHSLFELLGGNEGNTETAK
jgi:hypothetical protein